MEEAAWLWTRESGCVCSFVNSKQRTAVVSIPLFGLSSHRDIQPVCKFAKKVMLIRTSIVVTVAHAAIPAGPLVQTHLAVRQTAPSRFELRTQSPDICQSSCRQLWLNKPQDHKGYTYLPFSALDILCPSSHHLLFVMFLVTRQGTAAYNVHQRLLISYSCIAPLAVRTAVDIKYKVTPHAYIALFLRPFDSARGFCWKRALPVSRGGDPRVFIWGN